MGQLFLEGCPSDGTILVTLPIKPRNKILPVLAKLIVDLLSQSFLLLESGQVIWHHNRSQFFREVLGVDS